MTIAMKISYLTLSLLFLLLFFSCGGDSSGSTRSYSDGSFDVPAYENSGKTKKKGKKSKYSGWYTYNGEDTVTEIRVSDDGSSFYGHTDNNFNQRLASWSGTIEGKKLIFDGNNSDVNVTGALSGSGISMNMWTSLYGDNPMYLRKD